MIGSDFSLLTIFLVGAAFIIAASELGRWIGVKVGQDGDDNVGTLETATLTLLALMIGFTFAMALTRFEARSHDRKTDKNTSKAFAWPDSNDRFWPLADFIFASPMSAFPVAIGGKSGHRFLQRKCLLMTQGGHEVV